MVLVDFQIQSIDSLIEPFNIEQLNPASYDLVLGDQMTGLGTRSDYSEFPHATAEKPFMLQTGEVVLVHSAEIINLPNNVAAQFLLKSSRAREGYGHTMSGWCDPGWQGSNLVIELHNPGIANGLPLYPGLKIGQLVFHLLAREPNKSYAVTGRYNNDKGAQASKG